MWGIYGNAGSVYSRKYTGTWQTPPTGIYTAGGQSKATDVAPPSAIVDNNGVVHVVYGTGRKSGQLSVPTIEYAHNDTGATTFTTSIDLDPSLPNGIGDLYPTISLDSETNQLYVFWLRTDANAVGKTVMGRKCISGTWSNLTLTGDSTYTKQYLTSIYAGPDQYHICWEWTQNTTATIHVMFDKIIPEFQDLVGPVFFTAVLFIVLRRRTGKTR